MGAGTPRTRPGSSFGRKGVDAEGVGHRVWSCWCSGEKDGTKPRDEAVVEIGGYGEGWLGRALTGGLAPLAVVILGEFAL